MCVSSGVGSDSSADITDGSWRLSLLKDPQSLGAWRHVHLTRRGSHLRGHAIGSSCTTSSRIRSPPRCRASMNVDGKVAPNRSPRACRTFQRPPARRSAARMLCWHCPRTAPMILYVPACSWRGCSPVLGYSFHQVADEFEVFRLHAAILRTWSSIALAASSIRGSAPFPALDNNTSVLT
jgi:hypothetical protein